MFSPSRDEVRRFFCDAWQKKRANLPQQGAAHIAADLIVEHPEYHALLEMEEAINQDFTVENGQTNPFLHLSLHLTIAEQLSIDQPFGILEIYKKLREKHDVHAVEHLLMDALGQEIWTVQTTQKPYDQTRYLEALQRLV